MLKIYFSTFEYEVPLTEAEAKELSDIKQEIAEIEAHVGESCLYYVISY